VKGINKIKPIKSVINPGSISKTAAKAIVAPATISLKGISFLIIECIPDFNVCKPSNLAKYIPVIAVKNINIIVLKAPTYEPILIITNISINGIPIIIRKIMFI
jgi:hypothetical protein